jgi:hypothetical protein
MRIDPCPATRIFNFSAKSVVDRNQVCAFPKNEVMTELGGSQLVKGYKTQSTEVGVSAGQLYLIWVYGFNFEQGNYTLQLNLS